METHDLLRLSEPGVLEIVGSAGAPAWVDSSLRRAPWVVVRRARADAGRVPVGVRGAGREWRFATEIPCELVSERVRPFELAVRRDRLGAGAAVGLALEQVGPLIADVLGTVPWGPVGSVGFELASGVVTTNADSDLDLIVVAGSRLARDEARRLLDAFAKLGCRIDCQLIGASGSFALAEWAGGAAEVLLRTLDGPRLTCDPWNAGASKCNRAVGAEWIGAGEGVSA